MTIIGPSTNGSSLPPVRFQGETPAIAANSIAGSQEQPPQGYGAECGTAALFALLGGGYLLRRNPGKIMTLAKRLPIAQISERLPQVLKRFVK